MVAIYVSHFNKSLKSAKTHWKFKIVIKTSIRFASLQIIYVFAGIVKE
jgi:hypothetical protein